MVSLREMDSMFHLTLYLKYTSRIIIIICVRHSSYLRKHSCGGHFAHHVIIFIPIFGNNKSPRYFLIDGIWRGCKKLYINPTPWPKEWSDVSFDQVFGCFHRFFIAGRQENCQPVTKEEMEDESSKHCPDGKDKVA